MKIIRVFIAAEVTYVNNEKRIIEVETKHPHMFPKFLNIVSFQFCDACEYIEDNETKVGALKFDQEIYFYGNFTPKLELEKTNDTNTNEYLKILEKINGKGIIVNMGTTVIVPSNGIVLTPVSNSVLRHKKEPSDHLVF